MPDAEPSSRESATQRRSRENLEVVWEQLAEAFGRRFTSQYGLEPLDTWIRACQTFTDLHLARGLANWCADGNEWPPTLPEFIQAVTRRAPPEHKPFPKALPRPKASKGAVETWRTKMREMGYLKRPAGQDEHETEAIG